MYKIKDIFKYVARKELKVGNIKVELLDGDSPPKLHRVFHYIVRRRKIYRKVVVVGKNWVVQKIHSDYPHLVGHLFK